MSFAERVMRFTFSGAQSGTFSAAGLRAAASIQHTEGKLGVQAQVKIWGLTLAQMNNYSTNLPAGVGVEEFNLIVEAGDLGGQLTPAVNGPIWQSFIDLTDAPDSAFVVSMAGIADASTPIAAQSQPGAQKAEDLIQSLCSAAGLTFNNAAGAHAVLNNQSTYGSAIEQISKIATAAKFRLRILGKTISIWQQNEPVDDVVIDVGPHTGMVGYPRWDTAGLIVTKIYDPQIQIGRVINLSSSIPKANGRWQVVTVQHDLTTMMPKGPWFTTALLSGAAT